MSYPLRDEFHKARKAVGRTLDGLWPRANFADVTTALTDQQHAPVRDAGPEFLPVQAREFLEHWSTVSDREAILRVDRPCTVDPKMGILFSNGRVMWGSSDIPDRERNPRFFSHLTKAKRRLPAAILLHHFHGDNYFHFFLYVLSKAAVAERHGLPVEIPVLVSEKTANTRFFQQAMDLGVFGERQVLIQGRKETIAVEQAYVIRAFFCHKPYFDWVCDQLDVPAPSGSDRRIFVLRGQNAANGRAFRNQDEVNALAESFSFDLVDPSNLSLKEQIDLFSQASVIAGAHGAALTNILFRRRPPCHIIELFSPTMGSPHYYMLAKELGFVYESLMTLNPQGRAFTASTEVDLDGLKRVFQNL
ncbi:glycosyltransferase family 61 protein [uncultured Roseibium sp.]|uniref:glycosyltransferase family 61 protein n=1 Tax=uncultured Roseibium sp. TaxID=1936171 RepID=UPI002598DBB7|nr:glycosyltransferase family 61 protein [uncultured Roseibium sp.]